jgi:hypothetical protein
MEAEEEDRRLSSGGLNTVRNPLSRGQGYRRRLAWKLLRMQRHHSPQQHDLKSVTRKTLIL